ncbi:SMP-30/gluconolactonase/LRE family protein [Nocardiopsis sp. HNM0947]|uniref:SMP-30/gluconolactonase/LRE family protein n=1 Tax=Nocardiopsis coralli TaxID=2772213 RepID=A0ABR9P500_9ACTN|nr:SMP-30/gluconolactonase/LRE family protein [Nocardiopsis coralli]MBE2998926.1 SMP-30/gluconolactonase/LRE family protein [Nocardiopsis coralli]
MHTPRPLRRTFASAVCLALLCACAPPAAGQEAPGSGDSSDPFADERAGTVHTVAGAVHETERGEEIPQAPPPMELEGPEFLVSDSAGTVYVSDPERNRVVAVDPDGSTRVAAGGSADGESSGDGGPAEEAGLSRPQGLAVDSEDRLYIADTGNTRIRRVETDGTITTYAGTDSDDRPINAVDLAMGSDGTLYYVDEHGYELGAVDPDGGVTTIVGEGRLEGAEADGQPASEAELKAAVGVAVDGEGNVYVSDIRSDSVRRIDTDGTLHTFAGEPEEPVGADEFPDADGLSDADERGGFSGDGGPAEDAELHNPQGMAVDDDGVLHIADSLNHRVRTVDADGTIETVAGTGEPGELGDGGPALEARLTIPYAVETGPDGELLVSDADGLHSIDTDGTVSTLASIADIAGVEHWELEGDASETELELPYDLAPTSDGTVYVQEAGGWPVRAVDVRSGALTTLHASSNDRGLGGPQQPQEVEAAPDGTLYVLGANGPHRAPSGEAAEPMLSEEDVGGEREEGIADLQVRTFAAGPDGELLLSDMTGLARLEADGSLTSVGDAGPVSAAEEMAVAPDGTVYYTETMDDRISAVEPDGTEVHVAGLDADGYTDKELEDGRPATETVVQQPTSIAVDPDGRVYVSSAHGIRVVEEDGTMRTVLNSAQGEDETSYYIFTTIETDPHGNLYFTDLSTNQIKVVVRPGEVVHVPWAAVAGWGALGALALFVAAGAFLLRDELGTLVRNPRRWPVAAVTVVVLLVAGVLDAFGRLNRAKPATG